MWQQLRIALRIEPIFPIDATQHGNCRKIGLVSPAICLYLTSRIEPPGFTNRTRPVKPINTGCVIIYPASRHWPYRQRGRHPLRHGQTHA